jgi:hypothetical protein
MKTFLISFSFLLIIGIAYTILQLYQKNISFNYGFLQIAALATIFYLVILSLKSISKKNDE